MSDLEHLSEGHEPFDLERATLDQPTLFETDWGGDGTELLRPVRAHVLAALRPSTEQYQPPLDSLLTLGEIDAAELERLRIEYGIGQMHVPELVRMLRDRALNTAYSDTPQVYAPGHAFDLLADLDLSAVVPDLIPLFDVDFEQMGEGLPRMLGNVGAPALVPLRTYLNDHSRWLWGRARAADALKELAERHPGLRADVVATLSASLAAAESDHEVVVTEVMCALIDLKAVETLPLIRRAFELDKIDETMNGPWGDVLGAMGIEPDADDPLVAESQRRYEERHARMLSPNSQKNLNAFLAPRPTRFTDEQATAPQKRKREQARKEKQKRKAASAARKANRKKRK